jgi:hypothetical protein
MTVRTNAFEMVSMRKLMIGLNPNQKCDTVFATGTAGDVKKRLAIQLEIEDRKP